MFVTLIVLVLSTVAAYVLYRYKRVHAFFEKRGIKYVPGVPIFGNIYKSTFYKRHGFEDMDDVYKAFPEDKYVGYIEGMDPIIMVRDPEVIRNITVKHFEHFVNHKEFVSPEMDPLFGGSLLLMKDERWRDMRTTLSPAFTSSKMRAMLPFMTSITANIIEHLRKHSGEEIDVDDLVRRYTNDVIASTAFGVQVNSLTDKDNEFYKTGQNIFEFGLITNVLLFVSTIVPWFVKKSGLTIFPRRVTDFFTNLINVTIDYREKNNIVRPDMIQLMMEAAKGTLKGDKDELETNGEPSKPPKQWTKQDLMSQMFIFFVAGFESSASAVAMSIHELAINQDVQEKLYQEIREHKEQNNELTFEGIATLKYLDCVINETLRKWAPTGIMDRVCAKAYELPPSREGAKPVKVNPGDTVYNMVNVIQMDPKYFPNPEVFDPDRFRDDKKHIKPFTYMPFGMGPRNCIALRFAMLEVKVILYQLIENFKLVKGPKTSDPIKLRPHFFNVKAQGGTWVRFEARE